MIHASSAHLFKIGACDSPAAAYVRHLSRARNSASQQIRIFATIRNPLERRRRFRRAEADRLGFSDRFRRLARDTIRRILKRSVFSSARADRVPRFSRRPRGMNRLGLRAALLASHCSLLSLASGRAPVAYLAGRGAVQSNWQAWKIMLMECDRERSISFIPHGYSICLSTDRGETNGACVLLANRVDQTSLTYSLCCLYSVCQLKKERKKKKKNNNNQIEAYHSREHCSSREPASSWDFQLHEYI